MTRLLLIVLIFPLAACLLSGVAPGQEKKPEDKKDPLNSFEPRSKPGAGHKFLEAFVGDWEVAKTFHPRTGDPVHVKGTCRQR